MNKIGLIPGITDDEMKRLLSVLKGMNGLDRVILYGSRAKGTYRPGSDIDLTLVGAGLSTRQLIKISVMIEDILLPYEVDLSIMHHISNPDLIDHINRIGKVVYSNDRAR